MRVVLCATPPGAAGAIARTLVQERLAACVNLVAGVTSVYRWDGKVCEDGETLLIIKVAAERVDDLQARLEDLHPHELPEFVVLDVDPTMSSANYLGWVRAESLYDPSGGAS